MVLHFKRFGVFDSCWPFDARYEIWRVSIVSEPGWLADKADKMLSGSLQPGTPHLIMASSSSCIPQTWTYFYTANCGAIMYLLCEYIFYIIYPILLSTYYVNIISYQWLCMQLSISKLAAETVRDKNGICNNIHCTLQ